MIAVTGAKGRLGSWFVKQGITPLICDIADREQVRTAVEEVQPQIIINCAAWTDVDGAEDEKNHDAVLRSNLHGPAMLRRNFDGYLVHISTGFVFDGKTGPNSENDEPAPVNFYGWSKLGGEVAAQMRAPTLIVRTLDLFRPSSNDFVRQIRDMLELNQPYSLPSHLFGSPTYIPHLVEGVMAAVEKSLTGVIHITGDTVLSRQSWGRMIAEAFGFDPELIEPTDQILGQAPRPLRGGLLVDKAKALGIPIYSPEEGLRDLAECGDES